MVRQSISERIVHRLILLSFREAFPNETALPASEYIKNADKTLLLNAATHFLGFKSFNSELANAEEAMIQMFSAENTEFANCIYQRIIELENAIGAKYVIFNTYSSLKLFQLAFEHSSENSSMTPAELERNLFNAYLVINSEFTAGEANVMRSLENVDKTLRLSMIDFCNSFIYWDIEFTNLNLLAIGQMFKSILLFRFLESNDRTAKLLQLFLEYYECPDWKEYLKRLYPVVLLGLKKSNDKDGTTELVIQRNEYFESTCRFIDKISIPFDSSFSDYDFNILRSSPIYKVSAGYYRFIFTQFAIEKLYKGVYFALKKVNDENDIEVPELKSLLGEYFSERILVYKTIDQMYGDKYIKYSGENIKMLGYEAEPDYYLRIGKNIFLFESKDFLIKTSVKESRDFNQYEQEFKKILYQGDRNRPKAILQLIRNIKRVLNSEFKFDTRYKYKEVVIYPLIITHDSQYNVRGLNRLINFWFQPEVEKLKEEGWFTLRVQPIVLVDIDNLITTQDAFRSGEIKLNEILDAYINFIKIDRNVKFSKEEDVKKYFNNKNISFSDFHHAYCGERKIKFVPEMLNVLGTSLFE